MRVCGQGGVFRLVGLASWVVAVAAQITTEVNCIVDLWTGNAQGLSPCLVAAELQGVCNAGNWNIAPLPLGSIYAGPPPGQSSACGCSTVTYSMVSACGACQNRSVATWPVWISACSKTDITISGYPKAIPSGITVPQWAYLNVTTEGVWDPVAAENNLTTGGAGVSTATSLATSIPSSHVPSSTTSPSHIGAIAGGAIGGFVGLALISLTFMLVYRRKRLSSKNEPSHERPIGEKVNFELANSPGPTRALGATTEYNYLPWIPPNAQDSAPNIHQEHILMSALPASTVPFTPGYIDEPLAYSASLSQLEYPSGPYIHTPRSYGSLRSASASVVGHPRLGSHIGLPSAATSLRGSPRHGSYNSFPSAISSVGGHPGVPEV
ncbi:hypothetical protein K439DRAFT_1632863 [Ramaria rubella]|nr:hypothetical protein K439DRAFT_1632863 [Ramaria rubella]